MAVLHRFYCIPSIKTIACINRQIKDKRNKYTHFRPIEYSIKVHVIKSGRSIVYVGGVTGYTRNFKTISKLSLMIILSKKKANSVGPDEMLHYAKYIPI